MDNAKIALLGTLLLGIFILIGALMAFLLKKQDKVVDFSIGLALGVIGMLIITDLIPEIIEELHLNRIYIFIIGAIFGFLILKLLDHYIPDHDEEPSTKKELGENLNHIGIITSIALVIHNIIEGMAVYSSAVANPSLGVALSLGVGFHNLPLGIVIGTALKQSDTSLWETICIISIVTLSTFFGGIIMFFINTGVSSMIVGGLLSITLGMLLYISIIELIPRIRASKNKKISYLGMGIGILILLLSLIV